MTAKTFLLALLFAAGFSSVTAYAQGDLTGMFRLTRQASDIVEPDFAKALEQQKILKKNEELQWQVYVPETYTPDRPAGLFVYIDPDGQGRIPDSWQEVFDRHNVIWIGVRQTQRKISEQKRVWQAILGSRAIEKDYSIDMRRLYLGGYADTVPSVINTLLTANEFSGAIYIRGSLFSPRFTPDHIQSLQRKYHVFMTGTDDERKGQIQADYEAYRNQGISNVKLIFDTQRLGATPQLEYMDEAFGFLDARLRR